MAGGIPVSISWSSGQVETRPCETMRCDSDSDSDAGAPRGRADGVMGDGVSGKNGSEDYIEGRGDEDDEGEDEELGSGV